MNKFSHILDCHQLLKNLAFQYKLNEVNRMGRLSPSPTVDVLLCMYQVSSIHACPNILHFNGVDSTMFLPHILHF